MVCFGRSGVQRETSNSLGQGFRCGFLGVLHMEVFHQRLEDEFGASVIATAPTGYFFFSCKPLHIWRLSSSSLVRASVPYKCTLRDGSTLTIDNPSAFPESRLLTGAMYAIRVSSTCMFWVVDGDLCSEVERNEFGMG